MVYGLADVAADISEGYQTGKKEKEEGELRKMKFDQLQGQMKQTGFQDSIRQLMMGNTAGSMESWNKNNEDKISDLEYDRDSGIVSWFDQATQKPIKQDIRVLAKLSGLDMGEDIKAKREHELKLAGVRSGGAKGTTLGKNVTFLTQEGMPFAGRTEAALKYLNTAKASPERTIMQATKIVDDAGTYDDETGRQKQIEDLVRAAGESRKGLYGPDAAPVPPPGAEDVAPPGAAAPPQLGRPKPSKKALDRLRSNPTKEEKRLFKEYYGVDPEQYLGKKGVSAPVRSITSRAESARKKAAQREAQRRKLKEKEKSIPDKAKQKLVSDLSAVPKGTGGRARGVKRRKAILAAFNKKWGEDMADAVLNPEVKPSRVAGGRKAQYGINVAQR